jgi:hypothetical protein
MSSNGRIPLWKHAALPVIVGAILLVGCAQAPLAEMTLQGERGYAGDSAANWEATEAQSAASIEVQERLIIRNAELAIVVDDAEAGMDAIEALVARSQGWVVISSMWETDGIKRGSMTVRVPADGLDTFLEEVHRLANEVTSESTSGQDVTEEYVDLEAQLTNLEATAARVRSFLDEAKDVDEALAVNSELSRLEEQIERINGRIQFLEQSARFSQISIQVTPDALMQPVTIGRWQPQGTARTAIEALIKTLQWVADALILVALYLVPMGLVIGLPLFFVIRFLARRQKRRENAEPAAE